MLGQRMETGPSDDADALAHGGDARTTAARGRAQPRGPTRPRKRPRQSSARARPTMRLPSSRAADGFSTARDTDGRARDGDAHTAAAPRVAARALDECEPATVDDARTSTGAARARARPTAAYVFETPRPPPRW